jgi:3-polyprenyl-4-hydroxybenzoate decarboxylase
MHWQIGKGRRLSLRALGSSATRPLRWTVFLGGPPALILSAVAPLPGETFRS